MQINNSDLLHASKQINFTYKDQQSYTVSRNLKIKSHHSRIPLNVKQLNIFNSKYLHSRKGFSSVKAYLLANLSL